MSKNLGTLDNLFKGVNHHVPPHHYKTITDYGTYYVDRQDNVHGRLTSGGGKVPDGCKRIPMAAVRRLEDGAHMIERRDRAVDCRRCTSITPPYVSYIVNVQPKPLFCPTCKHQRVFRPYNYADILCTDYAGLTMVQACKIINIYNEQVARGIIKHSRTSKTIDVLDYIKGLAGESTGASMPSIREFICPLDVSCKACGGSYTLLRNVPDINKTVPLYCVWCSSSNVTVSQQSTEETWWTSLSQHYSLPTPILKVFYDRWTTHSNKVTFKDYMESDMIKGLLQDIMPENDESKEQVSA